MTRFYNDYTWKNGIPFGISPCEEIEGIAFKVIADPYYKRISVEKYEDRIFTKIIYDSAIFDFRLLRPNQQVAWEKKVLSPTRAAIHDHDDRLLFFEEYEHHKGKCRTCTVVSPHQYQIGIQMMFYTECGDPFDGVILYDNNGKAIITKKYSLDKSTGEFQDLLSEAWATVG